MQNWWLREYSTGFFVSDIASQQSNCHRDTEKYKSSFLARPSDLAGRASVPLSQTFFSVGKIRPKTSKPKTLNFFLHLQLQKQKFFKQ